ncbi:hypothetical protein DL768_006161 [Monosporascus sp. mg162]|nr:hypothetical protein DL768_006161 [Monosporascus sp. mg162]
MEAAVYEDEDDVQGGQDVIVETAADDIPKPKPKPKKMYNIMSLVTNIITLLMLNPTAWNWGAKLGFFWAGTCFLCAVWTYFRLPEAKGRTYGELDVLFENGVSARKFKSTAVDRIDGQSSEHAAEKEKVLEEEVMVERADSR